MKKAGWPDPKIRKVMGENKSKLISFLLFPYQYATASVIEVSY